MVVFIENLINAIVRGPNYQDSENRLFIFSWRTGTFLEKRRIDEVTFFDEVTRTLFQLT